MTNDDAHDDDPQLKSLRAIWLQMPDEEPPQGGLAELMAAARVKADEMAKPSWWQRTVDLLRRPPVLALASVMVLIGGAVFITQRSDKLQAQSPAAEQPVAEQDQAGSSMAQPTTTAVEPAPPALEPEKPLDVAAPEPAQKASRPARDDRKREEQRNLSAGRAGEGLVGGASPDTGAKRGALKEDTEKSKADSFAFDGVAKDEAKSEPPRISTQAPGGGDSESMVTVEKKTASPTPRPPELVIQIPNTGDVKIAGKSVPETQLDAVLRAAHHRDRNTSIVLAPDKGVPHARVVKLMERAKQLGLTRFAISATAY